MENTVVIPNSKIGKFLNAFPPVVINLITAVLIVLCMFLPDVQIQMGEMQVSLQWIAAAMIVPTIYSVAKAFGVNMTSVQKIVDTVTDGTGVSRSAVTPQAIDQKKMQRWLSI